MLVYCPSSWRGWVDRYECRNCIWIVLWNRCTFSTLICKLADAILGATNRKNKTVIFGIDYVLYILSVVLRTESSFYHMYLLYIFRHKYRIEAVGLLSEILSSLQKSVTVFYPRDTQQEANEMSGAKMYSYEGSQSLCTYILHWQ